MAGPLKKVWRCSRNWTRDFSIRSPMLNHWSHHLGLILKKHSFSRQPLLFWPKRIISAFFVPKLSVRKRQHTYKLCCTKSAAKASIWPPLLPLRSLFLVRGCCCCMIPTHDLWLITFNIVRGSSLAERLLQVVTISVRCLSSNPSSKIFFGGKYGSLNQ